MEVKASKKHTMFNPAFIDDYGFTPEEFRVFSRIMRRSLGSEKGCYESIPQMAETLMISQRLIRRALNVLIACNAVSRTVRIGKSDLLDFNICDEWKPSSELVAIRTKIDAATKQKDRQRKAEKPTQVVAETTGVGGCGNDRGVVAETTGVVVAETTDEGISNKLLISHKGNPLKVITPATAEIHENLRFFPFLERSQLSVQLQNQLVEVFSYIANEQNRRTLIKEYEWLELCEKLMAEGMSPNGIKNLYRYCKEKCHKTVITPKVMDWKFAEYKLFVGNLNNPNKGSYTPPETLLFQTMAMEVRG